MLTKQEIEETEKKHNEAMHLRLLQKTLAKDITICVHSKNDFYLAAEASEILFGEGTNDVLKKLSENDLLSVMEGVPQIEIAKSELERGIGIIDFLSVKTNIFPSKGEARKMLMQGGVAVNKVRMQDIQSVISNNHLLNNRYILTQKGKKNYYLIKVL